MKYHTQAYCVNITTLQKICNNYNYPLTTQSLEVKLYSY
jgi:hypothetical protein